MKRIMSLMILLVMLMSFCIPTLAVEKQTKSSITVTSTVDVEVGTERSATFVCGAAKGEITLTNGNKKVATMSDNGRNGDEKKNDGIASASLLLSSDKRKTEKFYAYAEGKLLAEYTVNYYNELTEADFTVKDAINSNVAAIEQENLKNGEKAAYVSVLNYLESCDDIESVECTENTISYTTNAGITSVYAHLNGETKGTSENNEVLAQATEMNKDDIVSWTNPNVLVLRPFRNGTSENASGFHEDYYTQAADKIVKITGGKVILFDDDEANAYNFQDNLDKVGFFLMDSHGLDTKHENTMLSTIIMKNVNNDGITSADWSAGRVFDMYYENLIAVSGDYIKAHYTEENRKIENAVCYLGICLGMKYDSLKKPLSEMGARLVMGYTETVSTYYDNNMLAEITNNIIKAKDDRTYTYAEAIDVAKRKFGEEDPAQWGAVLEVYGNDSLALVLPQNTLTSVYVEADEYDAIVNQNCYIMINALSGTDEAHGFTQEWSSSDTNIVKVVSPRIITGVSEGTATVTCVTECGGNSLTTTWKINVRTVKPESIVMTPERTQLQPGGDSKVICTVYPRNASYRNCTVGSTNKGAISVSMRANVPVLVGNAPGNSLVWAKVDGTDLMVTKKVTVASKKMFMETNEISNTHTYVLAVVQDGEAHLMTGSVSGSDVAAAAAQYSNSFVNSSDAKGNKTWSLISTNGGFYIYNIEENKYVSINSDCDMVFSASRDTLFEFDGVKMKVKNTDETKCYIRYRADKDNFCFSTRGNASELTLLRLMDYNDDSLFSIVDFETESDRYSLTVENGKRAVAAEPIPISGKTFLGWDAPLSNVKESFATQAMYRDGETDRVVVTFLYTDGTVIETKEFARNEAVKAPEAAAERDGLPFCGWSEELGKADHNMTVFALYGSTAILGDVTGDGVVNTSDAVMILRQVAELVTFDSAQAQAADVNHDNKVNTSDAVVILKYAAGLIDKF